MIYQGHHEKSSLPILPNMQSLFTSTQMSFTPGWAFHHDVVFFCASPHSKGRTGTFCVLILRDENPGTYASGRKEDIQGLGGPVAQVFQFEYPGNHRGNPYSPLRPKVRPRPGEFMAAAAGKAEPGRNGRITIRCPRFRF